MIHIKYLKNFLSFNSYKTSPLRINSPLLNPTRKYSTQKFANALHKPDKFPGGRVSNVKKELSGFSYFMLLIPITTFGLGCWQIKRKKWKENLIEGLMFKTKEPPVPLPTEINEVDDLEFRRVTVTGEFDHSGEMYLGPRSCLVDGESTYSGQLISTSANGSSGYYVVTPFIRSDTKERILVNRGWVPFSNKNPKSRLAGQITGEKEITGIVRKTEKPSPFSIATVKEDVRIWFVRDVEKMAEMIDAVPIFLDATVETSVPGGPIGGQTRSSLRNEHLSYIITWYSLSAATGYMWYLTYLK